MTLLSILRNYLANVENTKLKYLTYVTYFTYGICLCIIRHSLDVLDQHSETRTMKSWTSTTIRAMIWKMSVKMMNYQIKSFQTLPWPGSLPLNHLHSTWWILCIRPHRMTSWKCSVKLKLCLWFLFMFRVIPVHVPCEHYCVFVSVMEEWIHGTSATWYIT